jgi:hypothetical protein
MSTTLSARNAVAIVSAATRLIAPLATVVQASRTDYSTTMLLRPKGADGVA